MNVFIACIDCGKEASQLFFCWDCKDKKCPNCDKAKMGIIRAVVNGDNEKSLICQACENKVKVTFNGVCDRCVVFDKKLNGCACDLVVGEKIKLDSRKRLKCSACSKEFAPEFYCDNCVGHKYSLLEAGKGKPSPPPVLGGNVLFLLVIGVGVLLVIALVFAFVYFVKRKK